MSGLMGYGANQIETSAKSISRLTLSENLQAHKVELEKRLSEINDAIAALDSHPEVLSVLEKLSKLGY